jgi:hypothetical protein
MFVLLCKVLSSSSVTQINHRANNCLPRKEVVVNERSACTEIQRGHPANMEGVVDKMDLTSNNLVD